MIKLICLIFNQAGNLNPPLTNYPSLSQNRLREA
jgi:hypothetical protein